MIYASDVINELIVSIITNELNDLVEKKPPYERKIIN